MSADSLPYQQPRTCVSCGTQRPEVEMRHPLSPSWNLLPDLWECVDAEACWQAVRCG